MLIAVGFAIAAGFVFTMVLALVFFFVLPNRSLDAISSAAGALGVNVMELLLLATFGYFVFYKAFKDFQKIDFKKYQKK